MIDLKSRASAQLVGLPRSFAMRRRRRMGYDSVRVISATAQRAAAVRWPSKFDAALRAAWRSEWARVVECYYAQWGYAHLQRAMNRRANWRRKYKVDPVFTAKRALRNQTARIKRITKRSKRSNELLGCTYEQARKWIESQFERGMSWSNAGVWEIDHIVPISSFDLTNDQQVRCVNHYTNLRPLWAEDNRRKGDKIEREHQLALL